jgi:hypothetical protein
MSAIEDQRKREGKVNDKLRRMLDKLDESDVYIHKGAPISVYGVKKGYFNEDWYFKAPIVLYENDTLRITNEMGINICHNELILVKPIKPSNWHKVRNWLKRNFGT